MAGRIALPVKVSWVGVSDTRVWLAGVSPDRNMKNAAANATTTKAAAAASHIRFDCAATASEGAGGVTPDAGVGAAGTAIGCDAGAEPDE